jgi:hypothetical protein
MGDSRGVFEKGVRVFFSRSRLHYLPILSAIFLSACSGGGHTTPAFSCSPDTVFTFTGGATTSLSGGLSAFAPANAPLPSSTNTLLFTANPNAVIDGMVLLSGSDGSSVTGLFGFNGIVPAGTDNVSITGYQGHVSGLHPNTTYAITLESLTGADIDGSSTTCQYPTRTAGTFQTGA